MSAIDLRRHYLDYIATLNQRRLGDLPGFVADALVYNGAPMTGRQYRELLEDDMRRIPDLFFDVQHLVVDDGHVACRIRLTAPRASRSMDDSPPARAGPSPNTSSTSSPPTASPRCGPSLTWPR